MGGIIDNFVVGHTMTSAEAGSLSLSAPLWFFTSVVYNTLASGCRPLCANELSRGNRKQAGQIYSAALAAGLILTLVFVLFSLLFKDTLVQLLGAKQGTAVYEPCKSYITGILIGFPAAAMICLLSVGIGLEGGNRWTLYCAAVVTGSNILLDIFVALILKGGIFFIGLTSSLSYFAGLSVLILYYRKKKDTILLKPDFSGLSFRKTETVLFRGLPHGISRLTASWKSTYLNHIFASAVTAAGLAAYNVQVQINYVTNALFLGIAQALSLLVCVHYAEENRSGIRRTLLSALACDILFGLIITFLLRNPALRSQILRFYLGNNTDSYKITDFAIYFYAFGLLGQVLSILFANYLQAVGRTVWSAAVYVLSDIVFVRILVAIGHMRVPAGARDNIIMGVTFLEVSWAQYLMLAMVPVIILLVNLLSQNRPRFGWDTVLMLPKDFGVPEDQELTAVVRTKEEVARFSKEACDFCLRQNTGRKEAYIASLAAEEMGVIIMNHGFGGNTPHTLEMRLIRKNNTLILRLRDDCDLFDPIRKLAELPENADADEGIGIRMIMKLASEVSYTSALKLNNLMIRIDLS